MSLQVLQINNHLEELYFPYIDISDINDKPEAEVEKAKKSRSLAALSLSMLAESTPEEACKAVTDGFNDNGIDGIHYSEKDGTLHIVQSKYHEDGNGSIEVGDLHKFMQGVSDLIQGKFEKFNDKVTKRSDEILQILLNAENRFNLLIIYSGKEAISHHCEPIIEEFLDKNNEIGEKFYFTALNIKDIYSYISSGAAHNPINVDVAMHNWSHIEKPVKSIYGQIAGSDLAAWYSNSGPHLFSPNIRVYLGSTDVNEGIVSTVTSDPDKFWYYNNGITVLCDEISKKAIGGDAKETGYFECKNIKIVNGAQTVGTLHSMLPKNQENLEKVRVWARIIEVSEEHNDLSLRITRTNNTQNRIEKRDFVSLDPEQKRLHDELILEKIRYLYKSGETAGEEEEAFDLNEATVARACVQDDVQYAVQAKREISKLWDDINSAPYKVLFNSGIQGPRLHQEVQLLRKVDDYINATKKNVGAREKLMLSHGNRFLLHCVFGHYKGKIYETDFDGSDVEDTCTSFFELMVQRTEELYPESYLASLFKNLSKCRDIKKNL